jgi:hypothetical protein
MEGINQRNAAIASFLKGVGNTGTSLAKTSFNTVSTTGSYVSSYASDTFSSEGGSYILRILFFLFLYLFIAFIILLVVHNTIYPIFIIKPGDKGLIRIPGYDDGVTYLTKREVPPTNLYYPKPNDKFAMYKFLNNFTISVDIYARKLPSTNAFTRVILFKAPATALNIPPPPIPPEGTLMSIDRFLDHMANYTSMIMYLTDTNDLSVTLFSGDGKPYSIPYIKNIPLYTPFRVTVTVDNNMFIVYLNARQVYQRIIPGGISNNFRVSGAEQKFFIAPDWANLPTQTVFLHNLHIWDRTLLFSEVAQALPALANEADFALPGELTNGEGTCS